MRILKLDNVIEESLSMSGPDEIRALMNPGSDKPFSVRTYFSKAIQDRARISESQLKHWTVSGVLLPYKAVKGTGKMHVYDHQNLIEAMICRELSQYSINFRVMKEILDILRSKKWLFKIGFDTISHLFAKRQREETELLGEWEKQAPRGFEDATRKILDIMNSHKKDKGAELQDIVGKIPKPHNAQFIKWINKRHEIGEVMLKKHNAIADEIGRSPHACLERSYTIWERFKLYPRDYWFFLILWKDSAFIELSEPRTGEYSFCVVTEHLDDIISRCNSSIVVNLSSLLSEAGDFYEEDGR